MRIYTVHFDGSIRPRNPGGVGFYGYTIKIGEEVIEGSGRIGQWPDLTNNFAEFFALYRALEKLASIVQKPGHVEIKGDSQLVIKILSKKWKARREREYYKAYEECHKVIQAIRKRGVSVSFSWIPRDKNTRCDKLAKRV